MAGLLKAAALALVWVAAAAAAAPAKDPRAEDPRAERLLAEAKAAMGGEAWDGIRYWHEHGTLKAGGLGGQYESWGALADLKSAEHWTLGPDSGSAGWDGKTAWSVDATGEVRMEASEASRAEALQQAYRGALAFWYPARWPAGRRYAGTRHAGGRAFDAVRIEPDGAEPFELWLERKTHRLAREVQLAGAQPHSLILSDYRKVSGVLVPFRAVDRVGAAKFDTVSQASAIALDETVAPERFAPPPAPAPDIAWPAGQDSVGLGFTLANNHIYLPVAINGRAPLPFLFDTGGLGLLDKGHLAALGISAAGALPAQGFGERIGTTGVARVARVEIGGLVLANQVFYTMDGAALARGEGVDTAGLVGYELPRRAVTIIDYARRRIRFVKPEAFTPPAGATAVPFTFEEHIPVVEASLDGIAGSFEIDTGARGSLTLMRPFVQAHQLMEKYRPGLETVTGYGMGGPSRGFLVRAGSLAIGPVTVTAPVAALGDDARGATETARLAGNIGGGILRRFTLTLDYGHQRLWLEPNEEAGTPDIYDRSGLWLTADGGEGFAVADVVPASPASKAGIRAGERVLAIDGTQAVALGLAALRERLKAAPGTVLTLTVAGKAGTRQVALTLADQV